MDDNEKTPLKDDSNKSAYEQAWEEFWRIVDEIGKIEPVDKRSSVEILAEMRR